MSTAAEIKASDLVAPQRRCRATDAAAVLMHCGIGSRRPGHAAPTSVHLTGIIIRKSQFKSGSRYHLSFDDWKREAALTPRAAAGAHYRLSLFLGGSGAKLNRPFAVSRTMAPPTLPPWARRSLSASCRSAASVSIFSSPMRAASRPPASAMRRARIRCAIAIGAANSLRASIAPSEPTCASTSAVRCVSASSVSRARRARRSSASALRP